MIRFFAVIPLAVYLPGEVWTLVPRSFGSDGLIDATSKAGVFGASWPLRAVESSEK